MGMYIFIYTCTCKYIYTIISQGLKRKKTNWITSVTSVRCHRRMNGQRVSTLFFFFVFLLIFFFLFFFFFIYFWSVVMHPLAFIPVLGQCLVCLLFYFYAVGRHLSPWCRGTIRFSLRCLTIRDFISPNDPRGRRWALFFPSIHVEQSSEFSLHPS